ncbi:MAG: T9SS type A sorting domain-containing protein [Flavobacterium sp.]
MKKLYSLLLIAFSAVSLNAQVVISQVYGGGGNTNAPYTHDFVELFNKGTVSVDISGYSIQYASATGTSWSVNAIPSGTTPIAPGKYYLIKLAGGTTGIALPTADLDVTTSPINMSGTNGKVALVNNTTALSGATLTTGSYIDLVGFGTGSAYEGTAAVGVLSNTTAAIRLNGGCTDNNQNSTDFIVGTPTPRNSATATNICSTAPTISIASPSNNTIFAPTTTSVNVGLSINNFIVGNPGTGIDGHIHYTVNGGATVMKYDTAPIVLNSLTPGTYTIFVQLVNNSHTPIVPATNATITFTIASYNIVANIAALRADVLTNGIGRYYQISSNPVVTFTRATRNQKYIQDASAAIIIDDPAPAPGVITTPVTIGDALSGLKGQTLYFNGLLEFLPIENVSIGSTGNSISPEVVSIADVITNPENYESELVRINNVTFDATATNFAVNTNTPITAPTATVFRTVFTASEVDYIGQPIPTSTTNIVVFPGKNTVSVTSPSVYFVARSIADINLSSASFSQINGLKMYPNPVKAGNLHIETALNGDIDVAIFDLVGKEVVNTKVVNNTINVANLTSGIYVVKITEEGKTSTQKLVID